MSTQPELFAGVAPTAHAPKPNREDAPHHLAVVAKRKAAGGDGWRWCSMQVVGERPAHAFLVEGGVPSMKKTGKDKGQPNWKGVRLDQVVVTPAEIAAEETRYETQENRCHKCGGSGEEAFRWSVARGTECRTCGRCGGCGRPPEATP